MVLYSRSYITLIEKVMTLNFWKVLGHRSIFLESWSWKLKSEIQQIPARQNPPPTSPPSSRHACVHVLACAERRTSKARTHAMASTCAHRGGRGRAVLSDDHQGAGRQAGGLRTPAAGPAWAWPGGGRGGSAACYARSARGAYAFGGYPTRRGRTSRRRLDRGYCSTAAPVHAGGAGNAAAPDGTCALRPGGVPVY